MAKYRKRPVVIEAFQFTGGPGVPAWFADAVLAGTVMAFPDEVIIKTLEGDMRCAPGDWIIRGIKNELYPCRADIFAATYEVAE